MEGGEPLTVWNFRENYNRNSSTLHGYTRNVHRVHSSVEGCYTWSKPTCTVTYIRSFSTPRPPSPPSLSVRRGGLCHRMGALQPRYLHITGVRRAGNRPSKYRSPLFSSLYAFPFLSPLSLLPPPSPKRKNFSLSIPNTRIFPRLE